MSDDKIKSVLQAAAEDNEFQKALLNDREATIKNLDLSDAEKNVLKSVPIEQLKKMIDQHKKFLKRPIGRRTALAAGLGATALIAYLMLPSALGITPDRVHETRTINSLKQIVMAEKMYKNKYGSYGTLHDLYRTETIPEELILKVHETCGYKITLTTTDEEFTAEAIHIKKPEKRAKFKVGPDGEIETIKPGKNDK